MKTLGIVVFLFLLYVGIFGANIENKTFTFKSKPFIKEWISSGKAEKDLNKLEKINNKAKEFVEYSTDSVTEKVDSTLNEME